MANPTLDAALDAARRGEQDALVRNRPRRRTRAELAEQPRIDFASLSADDLIDTNAIGQWLDRAPITIMDERRRGGGPPFVRIGRTVRYRVGDVRAWIAARTIGAKP